MDYSKIEKEIENIKKILDDRENRYWSNYNCKLNQDSEIANKFHALAEYLEIEYVDEVIKTDTREGWDKQWRGFYRKYDKKGSATK